MKSISYFNPKGFALIYVLIIISIFVITASTIASYSVTDIRIARDFKTGIQLKEVTESGLQEAMARHKANVKNCGSAEKFYLVPGNDSKGYTQIEVCDDHVTSTGYFGGKKQSLRSDYDTGSGSFKQPILTGI